MEVLSASELEWAVFWAAVFATRTRVSRLPTTRPHGSSDCATLFNTSTTTGRSLATSTRQLLTAMRQAFWPSQVVPLTYIFLVALIFRAKISFSPSSFALKSTTLNVFSISSVSLGRHRYDPEARRNLATSRANLTMRTNMSAMPSLPSLKRAAYTGRARNRREFSMPMFSGLWISELLCVVRYAAFGFWKTRDCKDALREKNIPAS